MTKYEVNYLKLCIYNFVSELSVRESERRWRHSSGEWRGQPGQHPAGPGRGLSEGAGWQGQLWSHQERAPTCAQVTKLILPHFKFDPAAENSLVI